MSESQVWFITGAGSNFGVTLIRAALAAGHRVVATARKLSSLSLESSDSLLLVELDVTQQTHIDAAFEAAIARFGHIDVVVNKAGTSLLGEVEAVPEEDARHFFEVQFWGPVAVSKAALKVFRETKPAGARRCIINVSSATAALAPPLHAFHAASKAALETLTLSLNRELPKEWNIRAFNVEIGGFESKPALVRVLPQPPAYAAAAPGIVSMFRTNIATNGPPPGIGDVNKMARSMLDLARPDAGKLPVLITLGSDAWMLARTVQQRGLEELQGEEARARSTDRDGTDPAVVEQMVGHISMLL
ncbi:hypothetical protein K488DRAFT_86324 [Vararia minispora EC-137]|uniref:Uncharacterized protein n=1 Tax=Vararia minispora EC-137 TaxID=1314806 RepID=A0ACB8QJF2_9AGAM|nr:hypothetical protein K488DRAFT_86324 [Vararia minispora EC-137]